MSDVFQALGSGSGKRVPPHGRAFPRRLIDRPSQRTHFRYHYVTPVLFTIRLRGRSPCFTIVGRKQIGRSDALHFGSRILVIFTVRGQRKFFTEPFRDDRTLHSAAVISSDEEVPPRQIRFSAKILGDSTRQHLNSSFLNERLWDKRGSLSITRETFRNFSFKGLPPECDRGLVFLVSLGSQNSSKEISSLNECPSVRSRGKGSLASRVSFLRGVPPSSRRVLPVRPFRYPRRIYFPRPPD